MSARRFSNTNDLMDRWFHHIANAFAVIGAIGLFLLMCVTVVSVFWRYALRDPIFGIGDISSMALTVVVAAGVAYGAVHMTHISVNIFPGMIGRKITRITDFIIRVLSVLTCGYAAWALAIKGSCGVSCGYATQNLLIPHMPFYFLLSASMAVVAAFLTYQLVIGIKHWNGDDPFEDKM
ncbi:hypothetical protein GCM10008927_28970 [Amylibacter ulvae]|uniref:TRAP transporter small permease protein n=1 Tax=Paramylibacter ulvae TaxID=1651968 RepID=A0ABQ3D7D5_9RHOB|nr:TRAP transporter small permease [Amylibacter ulvae]GHA61622.1 hypothetical protein GCM10008927_28970 [Amylibacter ulvae]